MNLTVFLSLISSMFFIIAIIILIRRKHTIDLGDSVFIPLLLSILLYGFIVFSNFLEHSGITDFFDPLEDMAEIVFTFVFLFFVNNWRKDRSEGRFRELFQQAPLSLAKVARDGRIIEGNELFTKNLKQYYGITIEDLPTLSVWWELAYPDTEYRKKIISEWNNSLERANQSGTAILPVEREIACQDGTKRTLIIGTSVIGENLLVSLVDITDRKRAEAEREKLQQELLQAQKLESIGILAGSVAHDYNNMLGLIMGYSELTLDEMEIEHPLRKNIENILDATHRSVNLTRQLLIFARKQTVAPVVIDLNESVEIMLRMLRRLIGENIELNWLPARTPCAVKMDPTQLDQILANLCVNARESIADVGQIIIKTDIVFFDETTCKTIVDCNPGSYVRLSVTDNGHGMDKETCQHIFDPFFTTKGLGRGTGLGLATVYGVVKQSDGFINLYSEPEVGTTFNIYIPLFEGEISRKKESVPKAVPHSKGETILMVEDDAKLIEMSRTMLEHLGYKVFAATTPGEAIRLAEDMESEIHLFLTDVVMPEMNGRELVDRLLKIRPGVKYLFMSGYAGDIITHRGILEGGTYFIQKPFSLQDISIKIRELLDAD